MVDFNFDNKCSGCGACYNVCPVDAICMVSNKEGFLVPQVDKDRCISCGKCEKVCPHINAQKIKGNKEDVKGVWLYASKNDEAKMKSSSGAACFELGKAAVAKGDYICGCVWDADLHAMHICGNTILDLEKTQGSKYVQSDVGECYKQVGRLLSDGKQVVFTGTPCQTTGMHNYVMNFANGVYRDRLITVAVICHGVASPKVWESYKLYAEEKMGSPLIGVNFRDKKKKGYKKSYCRFEYENGKIILHPSFLPTSKYMEATLVYNLAMRRSCSHCDCKGINVGIDLIVGDWYSAYKGDGRLGTSCIVAFTSRGVEYAKKTLSGLRDFSYAAVLSENAFIEKSIKLPEKRETFFEKVGEYSYWDKVEELYPAKYKYKKFFVKTGLYYFLKKFL